MNFHKSGVESIDNNLEQINQYCISRMKDKRRILFIGSTNPAFFKFYETLRVECKEYEFIWMRYKRNYVETFTKGYVIKIPSNINRSNYALLKEEIDLSDADAKRIDCISEFKWTYDNIMAVHTDNSPNHVKKIILLSEHYFEEVYSLLKPDAVFLWNPFVGFNKIAAYVAKKTVIPVAYVESGVLPGTIAFSTWGDLGESRPSKEPEFFMDLSVNDEEYIDAEIVLKYIKDSGFNRNVQPVMNTKMHIEKGKPIIFFAGQNDTECGLTPYGESEQMSSPIFSSSEEAMYFLAELAKERGWNLIYKPHPIVARRQLENRPIPYNVNYITEGNVNDIIDMSDVCITIASTTAYISLIRNKPVVMLGKIHLNGQGCTYEAYDRKQIEREIELAISKGYTNKQKDAFTMHIARMCKYYLYDSYQKRELYYGKTISEAKDYINSVIEGKAIF